MNTLKQGYQPKNKEIFNTIVPPTGGTGEINSIKNKKIIIILKKENK